MRRALIPSLAAVAALLGTTSLQAADYRAARSPAYAPAYADPPEFDWGGLYGGIHAGATLADFKQGDVAKQLAADAYTNHIAQDLAVSIARLTTSGSEQQTHLGGFLGFNWLWEDVVVGVELDYTHLKNKLLFSDSYSDGRRQDRGLFSDEVVYNASARSQLGDYGILKLRAGYPIGRFLPYATIGAVVGKQRVSGSYTSNYTEYTLDPVTGAITGINVGPNPHNSSVGKSGLNVGGALGLGVDYALLDNVILRAEYQYIGMADYRGLRTTANTFRFGAGLKY